MDVRTGQEFAAAMYTLIGSAKLDGRDLEPYLRSVLARIADHPVSQIHTSSLNELIEGLAAAVINPLQRKGCDP